MITPEQRIAELERIIARIEQIPPKLVKEWRSQLKDEAAQ